jgi:hypothetical protein
MQTISTFALHAEVHSIKNPQELARFVVGLERRLQSKN